MTGDRWVLVNSYHDGSGVLRAFGPYDSEQEAIDTIPKFNEMGIENRLEPVRLWSERPAPHLHIQSGGTLPRGTLSSE